MSGISKKLMGTTAAAGEAFTAIEDVFSTYLYTGNGSSQVIENGINLGQSFGSGSAEFDVSQNLRISSTVTPFATFTIEAFVYSKSGFTSQNQILGSDLGTAEGNKQVYIQNSTNYLAIYDGSSAHFSNAAVPQDQWVHVAITRSGSSVTFYINGVASGTATVSATLNFSVIGGLVSGTFINEDFQGYISNLRIVNDSVVYTSNFTPPTSELTAITGAVLLTCQGPNPFVDNSPNAFTITKNGNPQAATFGPFDAATPGEGGLVWIKDRGDGASFHALYDTERAISQRLSSNTTSAQSFVPGVTSFNADGFSLGATYNASGNNFASWTFRKAPRFFDVVTYTGDGNLTKTIAHNLGTNAGTIIVKRTDAATNWAVGVFPNGSTNSADRKIMLLNTTDAHNAVDTYSDGYVLSQSDTDFTVTHYNNNKNNVNASGGTYVAYLFAHDPLGPSGDGSDGLIACGSYTGNGSTNGPEIDLGWEPQFVILKSVNHAGNWFSFDNMRGITSNGNDEIIYVDISSAAEGNYDCLDLQPNGFKLTYAGQPINGSGDTYIYIAIRRGPMRQPTSGTEVFDNAVGVFDNPSISSNFPVDLGIVGRDGSTDKWYIADRLRGQQRLNSATTDAETSATYTQFDNMDGFFSDGFQGYRGYAFRRAPGCFDAVAYTGNGVAGRTVPHNLGVAPEMMIVRRRDASDQWIVYHSGLTNPSTYEIKLNFPFPETASSTWNSTDPTSDVFTLSGGTGVNGSNGKYIAYLFATLDGVSKVGSYIGTGGNINVDCGFSSGARFVLIKRRGVDYSSGWFVYDSQRGIISGNDPYLLLNDTSAEVTTTDYIDPLSSGFTVTSSAPAALNNSGETYIYLAIA